MGPWVGARPCPVLGNRPHKEDPFCKLQHVMRIPLKQPCFCFEPIKYDFFPLSSFQNGKIPKTCTEGEEQTGSGSHKCLDPAGKRGCQGFSLTKSVASNDIGAWSRDRENSSFSQCSQFLPIPGLERPQARVHCCIPSYCPALEIRATFFCLFSCHLAWCL